MVQARLLLLLLLLPLGGCENRSEAVQVRWLLTKWLLFLLLPLPRLLLLLLLLLLLNFLLMLCLELLALP